MSRVASNPITIPDGIEFNVEGQLVKVKGPKGALEYQLHPLVEICRANDNTFTFKVRTASATNGAAGQSSDDADALTGTMRALVNNMVNGVTKGFEKKLILIGVGFRALLKGKKLELTLGFSHPISFDIPDGITIDVPIVTEIIVKGVDKQLVGQVAAKIRAYRQPEPYKGKGIRYADEQIILKETKK